jgi:beta-glucosidase
LKIANQSDVIVAALGESAEMSGESSSRTILKFHKHRKDLLQELLKQGNL